MQIAEWLNAQGFRTNRDHPFGKDTVRDMLCNAYYVGKIRYRGMTVRPKGVSFRSTPPRYLKANTSRSSVKSCGNVPRPCVPAGG